MDPGENAPLKAVGFRHMRIMSAEKLAEFGNFSGKFHACLVCG